MSITPLLRTLLCSLALSVTALHGATVSNTNFNFGSSSATTYPLSAISNGNKALITFTVRNATSSALKVGMGSSTGAKYEVHFAAENTRVTAGNITVEYPAAIPAQDSLDIWVAYQDGRVIGGHGMPWQNIVCVWQDEQGAGTLSSSDTLMFATSNGAFEIENVQIKAFDHDTSAYGFATQGRPYTKSLSGEHHTIMFMAEASAPFTVKISGQNIDFTPPTTTQAVPYWLTSIKEPTGQHKISAGIGIRPGGTTFYSRSWSAPANIAIQAKNNTAIVLTGLSIETHSESAPNKRNTFILSPRTPLLYDWSDQWQLTAPQAEAIRIFNWEVGRAATSNTAAPKGLHIALHTAGDAHITNTTYDISLNESQAVLSKRDNPNAELFAPSTSTNVATAPSAPLPDLATEKKYWCAVRGTHLLLGTGQTPLSHNLAIYFDDTSVTANKPANALCAFNDADLVTMTHFSFAASQEELTVSNVSELVTATDMTLNWDAAAASPTPGSVLFKTRVASSSSNGDVVVGLAAADNATAAYKLRITQSGNSFITSLQKGDTTLTTNSWTAQEDQQLFADLTSLYAGIPQELVVYYHNGGFYGLLGSNNFLHAVDESPTANITRCGLAAQNGTITYSNTVVTDTVKEVTYHSIATEDNRQAHPIVPFVAVLPESSRGLVTFKATTTLSNLYAMFGHRDNLYTLRADAWNKRLIRAAVMHEKGAEKHVPTTSGSAQVAVSKVAPSAYWCAFDNGKIALGTGSTPGNDTVIAWKDTGAADCHFFSAMPYLNGAIFTDISVTTQGLENIKWDQIMTPLGIYPGNEDKAFVAHGLQNGAWHTDKTRNDWAHAWEFTDLTGKQSTVSFDLTGPLQGDATLILGPAASGTTFYAFTLRPKTGGTTLMIDTVQDGVIDTTKQVTQDLTHSITGTQTFTLAYTFTENLLFTLTQADTTLAEVTIATPAIEKITHVTLSAGDAPVTFANITGPIKTDVTVVATATSVDTNPLGSYEYSWQDEHTVAQADSIVLTGQLNNARPAHSACAAIIGLTSAAHKEADVSENGASYNLVIDYAPGATQATMYVAKHVDGTQIESTKLGETIIDVTGDDHPFNKWRSGMAQEFWAMYQHGAFFFGWGDDVGVNPVWFTVDEAPHADITQIGFSSKDAYISYNDIVLTSNATEATAFDQLEKNKELKLFGALPTAGNGVVKVKATAAGSDMYFSLYSGQKELVSRVHIGRAPDAKNTSLLHTAIPIGGSQELYQNTYTELKIGQETDYWLAYDDGNIAFGHGATPGESVGFVSAIPVEESRKIKLFALHNGSEAITYHTVAAQNANLDWGTLRKGWLTRTYGSDFSNVLPGLTEDENSNITAFATMGHIAATSATDKSWQKVWQSPSSDNLAFMFDVTKLTGPVCVFLSNQTASAEVDYYKVTIDPQARTINVSGHGASFTPEQSSYHLYTSTPETIPTRIANPETGTYLVSFTNQTLSIKYALNRESATTGIPQELTSLTLSGAPRGITNATVGGIHNPVTFTNPLIMGANGAQGGRTINIEDTTAASALVVDNTIITTGIPEYSWFLQPLNYAIPRDPQDLDNPGSFKLETTVQVTNPNIIDPRISSATDTIAIGLSPRTQDSGNTQPVLSFNLGNTQVVGFSKATHNILVKTSGSRTTIQQPLSVTRQAAQSGVAHQNGIAETHDLALSDGRTYELWVIVNQSGATQSISMGMYDREENLDETRLKALRNSRTGRTALWRSGSMTRSYLEAIAFASWGAEAEFSNIKISAFDPASLPADANAATTSEPDSLAYVSSQTKMDWYHDNLMIPLDELGGGVLKTRVNVTQTNARGEYMLALGLTSDPENVITTTHDTSEEVFKGAEYTLILRSGKQTSSYAYILKGGDARQNEGFELSKRSITNPDAASIDLKALLAKDNNGKNAEIDIWFKYVPRKNTRTFSFGFGPIAGNDQAWSWTEVVDSQSPPPALTQFGLGTWGTGVTYKKIGVTATEPVEIPEDEIEVVYDGTLSIGGKADPAIWNDASRVQKLFNSNNRAVPRKFSVQKIKEGRTQLRISFRPRGTQEEDGLHVIIDENKISVHDADTFINETKLEDVGLPALNEARTYWMSPEGNTLFLGVGDETGLSSESDNVRISFPSDKWDNSLWEFAIAHTEALVVSGHENIVASSATSSKAAGRPTKANVNRFALMAAAQATQKQQ